MRTEIIMHEMALCTEVVEVVLSEAEQVDAVAVNEVHLILGEVRDIVEDLFVGFFQHLARGTVAENAVVVFTRVPVTVECGRCGQVFPLDTNAHRAGVCPACHQKDYEMKSGMEFFIGSIDVTTEEEAQVKSA